MSRAKLSHSRRILLLGAIGLLLLLASWFDSTRASTHFAAFGKPPSPVWRIVLFTQLGKFTARTDWAAKVDRSPEAEQITFGRTPFVPDAFAVSPGKPLKWPAKFGFNVFPAFEYTKSPKRFVIIVPHWFLVLLYLAIWMAILFYPHLRRRLKHPHPPA